MIAPHIQRLIRPTPAEQSARPAEQRKTERGRSETKDQVTLSSQAQELLQLQKQAANTQQIRMEKVQALQTAIQKGAYDVPAQAIAQKMLAFWGEGSR